MEEMTHTHKHKHTLEYPCKQTQVHIRHTHMHAHRSLRIPRWYPISFLVSEGEQRIIIHRSFLGLSFFFVDGGDGGDRLTDVQTRGHTTGVGKRRRVQSLSLFPPF